LIFKTLFEFCHKATNEENGEEEGGGGRGEGGGEDDDSAGQQAQTERGRHGSDAVERAETKTIDLFK
jgi:hypothetical protein